MRKPNHSRNDPLERAIEMVLAPGSFISYRAASSFVEDVQTVADKIDTLIDDESERAVRLYEVFIAACHEKADEVDDSAAVSERLWKASSAAGSGHARRPA